MRTAAARAAAAAAVLACALAFLTWQVIAAGPLTGADMPLHRWVLRHGLDRSSPLWVPLGDLGDGRFAVPVLVVVAVVVCWRLRRSAIRPVLIAAAGSAVFTVVLGVLKTATGRIAPDTGSGAVFAGGTEFPSGHTFGATVIWGMAAWLVVLAAARAGPGPAGPPGEPGASRARPRRGDSRDLPEPGAGTGPGPARASRYSCLTAGAVAGLASAAAMVRMDYHWFSDVVGGWLLGMITLLVIVAAESASRRLQPRGGLLHRNGRPPDRDELTPEPPRPGRSSP